MRAMLEVLYAKPADKARESMISQLAAAFNGRLSSREIPSAVDVSKAVCLTYEFPTRTDAESAAKVLRRTGEHVEGPCDY